MQCIKMASPNVGTDISGYQYEFAERESVINKFECPLCLHVTREPYLVSCCRQHFCRSCISRVLTDNKPCPLCRAYPFFASYNKKQRRMITELKVYCTMTDRGCNWIGKLRELDFHLGVSKYGRCQYLDVSCTNNCGKILQRRQLPQHLKEECPKRDFTCQYCGYTATYEDVCNKHWPVCTKYPLPCPNDCGIGIVERGSLKKHLSECPLQLVPCEFSHLGCSEKMRRKDLSKHMEENTQKHLVMMSATLGRIMGMNTQLETKLRQSERRLAEKDERVSQLTTRLLTLERHLNVNSNGPLPPVEFTLHNLDSLALLFGKRWTQHPPFYTHYMGAKIKIALYHHSSRGLYVNYGGIDIELWQEPGEFDSTINWPVRCTVTVQILNQKRDRDHLQFSREYALSRPTKEDRATPDIKINILYSTLRPTKPNIQYIKDDCFHMRADVTLKK